MINLEAIENKIFNDKKLIANSKGFVGKIILHCDGEQVAAIEFQLKRKKPKK